jgi:dipeptidyl aminopeptidase/acylaminoacyl peptidase
MMTASPGTGQIRRLKHELLSEETNTLPRLAPDGRQIIFVRTTADGQELMLRTVDGSERRVAEHHGETITDLRWTNDSARCLYRHAVRGRELWRLSAITIASLKRVVLPAAGPVSAYWLSAADPAAVAYSCRDPRTRLLSLIRSDVAGTENPATVAAHAEFRSWVVDLDLRPRGGISIADNGSAHLHLGADLTAARIALRVLPEELRGLAVLGFDRAGQRLYVLSSAGAATRRLIVIDAVTLAVSEVFAHPSLDVESYPIAGEGVWFDPRTGEPDMCTVMGQRLQHHPLTSLTAGAIHRMAATAAATTDTTVVVDRSADDQTWLTVAVHDDRPIQYQRFEPASGRREPVFSNRPGLAGFILPSLKDLSFAASDGLRLTGYAMRPATGTPPFPTVVLVHGGPAGRDLWRFYADAQYLAALGYYTLHVNYRGSRGFGVEFEQAGHGEWGGRMQQDLYDAVAHAVRDGTADPERVVFFGTSYGGYAALLAACTRPDITRAAVAVSAPTNLISLTRKPPPYWQTLSVLLHRQIIQRTDGEQIEEATLRSRSPAHVVDRSCAPVLLVHGERDPRVPIAETDAFAAAAARLGNQLTYLRFADEGHHVRSNPNRRALFTAIEDFLETHVDNTKTPTEAALLQS